ncbi:MULTISPECIES: acyl-CoA thioesterase [unclassified Acidisoma]|jgi:acyl-CoA thioesterase YciA|uniref:acyl-CoA thioesterase n=1 Tax=unclassified Acidisoma TaxID=2634065 RepID=UPI00131D4E72|nr:MULTISPECIES: acyl-CoA thioesterase [unclassified Acidisoma]
MTEREPLIRVIAMPKDTNPSGDIFGGWLMAQMDLAAGNLAQRLAKGRCVTAAVDGMAFLAPVHVGDEVSFFGELLSVGRTSMKISVEAVRRTRFETETVPVTKAVFTFVALDEDRRPRLINLG